MRNCAGCGVSLNGHEEDYCSGCVEENQLDKERYKEHLDDLAYDRRNADRIDGYDRDDLGESPDY